MTFKLKRIELCIYIVFILLYSLSLCFDNRELSDLIYKLLFIAQMVSFAVHALAIERTRNSIFRKILTLCGAFILVGAIYLLSRTTRVWHTFRFETLIILLMGTWQVLYIILTGIEIKRLKEAAPGFFNNEFTKNTEEEQEDDDDENWVNKKFW